MKKLIITILAIVLCSFTVFAIVGHPASQVFPGLFAAGNYTFGTNTLFIDTTNNRVGIGTTSPNATLQVQGTSPQFRITRATASQADWSLRMPGSGGELTVYDEIAGAERMRIDSSGNVGIGTTSPNYTLDVIGDVRVNQQFTLGTADELTISGGVITVTKSYHNIDTQGEAVSDELDTINGGVDGMILVLRSVASARDVTLKDGTGNLILAGDFILSNNRDKIMLIWDDSVGGGEWHEISRSNNQ